MFLVYIFIVDIRQFYKLQDGTLTEVKVSLYTIQLQAWLTFGLSWINTTAIQLYSDLYLLLTLSFYPLELFNQLLQWLGLQTLNLAKWSVGIFQASFISIYNGVFLVIFNWLVPVFQWIAQLIPAPVWNTA